jgi:hypothetical protein
VSRSSPAWMKSRNPAGFSAGGFTQVVDEYGTLHPNDLPAKQRDRGGWGQATKPVEVRISHSKARVPLRPAKVIHTSEGSIGLRMTPAGVKVRPLKNAKLPKKRKPRRKTRMSPRAEKRLARSARRYMTPPKKRRRLPRLRRSR